MRNYDYNSADRKADRAVIAGFVAIAFFGLLAFIAIISMIGGVL